MPSQQPRQLRTRAAKEKNTKGQDEKQAQTQRRTLKNGQNQWEKSKIENRAMGDVDSGQWGMGSSWLAVYANVWPHAVCRSRFPAMCDSGHLLDRNMEHGARSWVLGRLGGNKSRRRRRKQKVKKKKNSESRVATGDLTAGKGMRIEGYPGELLVGSP